MERNPKAQYLYLLRASALKEPEVQHQPLPRAGRRCGGELADGLSLQFHATRKVASLRCRLGVFGAGLRELQGALLTIRTARFSPQAPISNRKSQSHCPGYPSQHHANMSKLPLQLHTCLCGRERQKRRSRVAAPSRALTTVSTCIQDVMGSKSCKGRCPTWITPQTQSHTSAPCKTSTEEEPPTQSTSPEVSDSGECGYLVNQCARNELPEPENSKILKP